MLEWLDGKKTYILGILGVVLAALLATGVVTPDNLREWNEVLGIAMGWVALVVVTLRAGISKIGK